MVGARPRDSTRDLTRAFGVLTRPQFAPHYLSCHRGWKFIQELKLPRRLVRGQPGLDVGPDLFDQLLGRRKSGQQLDECFDRLASLRIGHTDDRTGCDAGMFHDLGFNFGGTNPVAGAFDYVVVASLEVDVAFLVHMAEIARHAPFPSEFFAHRAGIFPVTPHHHRRVAPNCDFTGHARLQHFPFGRNDCDVVARIGLAQGFQARLLNHAAGADKVVRLGLAEPLIELDPQLFVDPFCELRTDGFGAADDAAEFELSVLFAWIFYLAQDLKRGGRIQTHRGAVLLEQSEGHFRIEAGLAAIREHRNSIRPNRQQAVEQPARPGPIRGAVVEVAIAQIVVGVVDAVVPQYVARDMQYALGVAGGAGRVHEQGGIFRTRLFHREARCTLAD